MTAHRPVFAGRAQGLARSGFNYEGEGPIFDVDMTPGVAPTALGTALQTFNFSAGPPDYLVPISNGGGVFYVFLSPPHNVTDDPASGTMNLVGMTINYNRPVAGDQLSVELLRVSKSVTAGSGLLATTLDSWSDAAEFATVGAETDYSDLSFSYPMDPQLYRYALRVVITNNALINQLSLRVQKRIVE